MRFEIQLFFWRGRRSHLASLGRPHLQSQSLCCSDSYSAADAVSGRRGSSYRRNPPRGRPALRKIPPKVIQWKWLVPKPSAVILPSRCPSCGQVVFLLPHVCKRETCRNIDGSVARTCHNEPCGAGTDRMVKSCWRHANGESSFSEISDPVLSGRS